MHLIFPSLYLIALHYYPMAETRTITVGHTCSIDFQGDKIVFNPDSAVMKATYTYYSFDKDDFKGVDLENLERPFEIEARCEKGSSGKYSPDDPYSAQPEGGFGKKEYNCKLLNLIKGE